MCGARVLLALVVGAGLTACDSKATEAALEEARQAKEEAKQARAETERAKQELEQLEAKQAELESKAEPAVGLASPTAPAATGDAPLDVPVAVDPAAAVPDAKPGEYSLEDINPIADDCKAPSVMLAAVSNNIAKKEDFVWAFAIQAFHAHPKFVLGNKVSLNRPGRVAIHQVQVNPKAVGLVAYCRDGATCNQVAAMYKATVPTSKPEVYCGKKWERGIVPRGLLNAVDLKALAFQKLESEPVSMCARVGICTKQQNPATPGDPGIECQRAPGKHKYKCGQEKTCEAVVSCVNG